MVTALHLKHAAEIWTNEGPTGRWASVLEGELRDYGGNLLFAGSADECWGSLRKYERKSIPVKLVPTKWEDAGEDVASATLVWQLVVVDR